MSRTSQALITAEGFRLYDHLLEHLPEACGLEDGDCAIYWYARGQVMSYQGEGLIQWCDGWQDQFYGEPHELLEWIDGFEKWVATNLTTLKGIERMAALLSW